MSLAILDRWSASQECYTPRWLFTGLDREFHFTLDPCATQESATCPLFFTAEQDGLSHPWAPHACFINPPWRTIGPWVEKARDEASLGATCVMLLPVRTDQAWWHDLVWGKAEVRWLRGRVSFRRPFGGRASKPASDYPGAVMIVIFRPRQVHSTP